MKLKSLLRHLGRGHDELVARLDDNLFHVAGAKRLNSATVELTLSYVIPEHVNIVSDAERSATDPKQSVI